MNQSIVEIDGDASSFLSICHGLLLFTGLMLGIACAVAAGGWQAKAATPGAVRQTKAASFPSRVAFLPQTPRIVYYLAESEAEAERVRQLIASDAAVDPDFLGRHHVVVAPTRDEQVTAVQETYRANDELDWDQIVFRVLAR